jgi:hypothetical protein
MNMEYPIERPVKAGTCQTSYYTHGLVHDISRHWHYERNSNQL